jgi:hypothetical protein
MQRLPVQGVARYSGGIPGGGEYDYFDNLKVGSPTVYSRESGDAPEQGVTCNVHDMC